MKKLSIQPRLVLFHTAAMTLVVALVLGLLFSLSSQEILTSAQATLEALRSVDADVEKASPLVAKLASTEEAGASDCRLADLIDATPEVEGLVERLLGETSEKGKLAFVGDGINDAPVLTRADIGIAMGAMGSDAAIEAADIVLMDDKPSKIASAIRIARKTMRIVWQNIVFALGVKFAVLVLAAVGLATMWLAVFADVGVAILAILNAMRCMRVKH